MAGVWKEENGFNMRKMLSTLLYMSVFCHCLIAADHPEPAGCPLAINAHAHNDYEHEYPLWDALHHGFSSIEVDVHLVDGVFYVAHDAEEIRPGRTINSLYLDPLMQLVMENGGDVYADGSAIVLLVDMKTEGADTWPALKKVLREYSWLLSRVEGSDFRAGAVTVIVSGNRDWKAMSAEENCQALYDGRIDDLEVNPGSPLIPLISASWSDEFQWEGEGEIPETDLEKMKNLIRTVHAQGRKIRFWGTDVSDPAGQEYIWDLLLEAGVDFINTDKLREFKKYSERRLHE